MNRNSHNLRGSSVNPAPHLRILLIALVLVLAIGSAGQIPSAQAAPAGATNITIWMRALKVGGERTICIGDKVNIDVSVLRKVEPAWYGPSTTFLPGIEVQASVIDSSIGTISPAKGSTRLDRDTIFTFSAQNPGTTKIQFTGKVNKRVFLGLVLSSVEVYTDIDVTVEDCKYKVNAVSVWVLDPGFTAVAEIDEAGMTVDAEGLYTGSASVHWDIIYIDVSPCTLSHGSVLPPTEAELHGELDGPDLLLDVVFQPVKFKTGLTCPDVGTPAGFTPVLLPPDPLSIEVPSSGGRITQAHALTGGNLPGWTAIWVERVTDH